MNWSLKNSGEMNFDYEINECNQQNSENKCMFDQISIWNDNLKRDARILGRPYALHQY